MNPDEEISPDEEIRVVVGGKLTIIPAAKDWTHEDSRRLINLVYGELMDTQPEQAKYFIKMMNEELAKRRSKN